MMERTLNAVTPHDATNPEVRSQMGTVRVQDVDLAGLTAEDYEILTCNAQMDVKLC